MSSHPPKTLAALAAALGATLGSDVDGSIAITGVAGMEEAAAGEITFLANPRYSALAQTTKASAVLVSQDFSGRLAAGAVALRTGNPYLAFARAIELFYQPPHYPAHIHPTAVVCHSARLGKNIHLGPYVVVSSDCDIGDDSVLLSHVVIYPGAKIGKRFFAHAHAVVREHCVLGDDVILQNGAVVGADGFGFAKDDAGKWYKIVQSGRVELQNDVEIQANACVDRASIGATRIAAGAKIDNLVQVGHGSTVGEQTMLCAQVGLAGSTEVGKNVILAGQVGVAGHCRIGDGAVATAQSGIPNDVAAGKTVSGYPAVENRQWLRSVAVFNRLPELSRAIRSLLGNKAGPED